MTQSARRVLVPASEQTGTRLAELLRAAGFEPVLAPMIASVSVDDATLTAALTAAADADWVVLTSPAAVDVLAGRLRRERWPLAVVGARTAAAARAAGGQVQLVADGGGAELAQAIIAAAAPPLHGRRILVLGSTQSHHTLDDLLAAAGAAVQRVTIYRTAGMRAPAAVLAAVRAGEIAAAAVTSGTVAAQLHEQLGDDAAHLTTVSLGHQTTADARRVGLHIDAEATEPTMAALVSTLTSVLRKD